MSNIENTNLHSIKSLIKPCELHKQLPTTENINKLVLKTRQEISDIIHGRSHKLLFIVGPCSIHNIKQALEYGKMLKNLADKVYDNILIVMRVYFEKPRTTVGWKGLINDPDLNNTCNVNKGLYLARKLLLDLNNIGMPCGYEVLDTITPQYISDLMSWGAVGARTTESQIHRQLVSGMSMPVGFKNGTGGNIKIASDAILSARYSHCFMGITKDGNAAICKTNGNDNCHIILRGGSRGPNYTEDYITECKKILSNNQLLPAIMVDCSHGNSQKNHKNQSKVLNSILNQIENGEDSIVGVMMESNINEGNQKLTDNQELKYGVSITDACINIEETNLLLLNAYKILDITNKNFIDID